MIVAIIRAFLAGISLAVPRQSEGFTWSLKVSHMSKFVWLGRKTGKSIGMNLGEIYDEQ